MKLLQLIKPVKKVIYPKCHKCCKEIEVPEASIFHIFGSCNYGSHFDSAGNELFDKLQNLSFCDECIHDFVGDID